MRPVSTWSLLSQRYISHTPMALEVCFHEAWCTPDFVGTIFSFEASLGRRLDIGTKATTVPYETRGSMVYVVGFIRLACTVLAETSAFKDTAPLFCNLRSTTALPRLILIWAGFNVDETHYLKPFPYYPKIFSQRVSGTYFMAKCNERWSIEEHE